MTTIWQCLPTTTPHSPPLTGPCSTIVPATVSALSRRKRSRVGRVRLHWRCRCRRPLHQCLVTAHRPRMTSGRRWRATLATWRTAWATVAHLHRPGDHRRPPPPPPLRSDRGLHRMSSGMAGTSNLLFADLVREATAPRITSSHSSSGLARRRHQLELQIAQHRCWTVRTARHQCRRTGVRDRHLTSPSNSWSTTVRQTTDTLLCSRPTATETSLDHRRTRRLTPCLVVVR